MGVTRVRGLLVIGIFSLLVTGCASNETEDQAMDTSDDWKCI